MQNVDPDKIKEIIMKSFYGDNLDNWIDMPSLIPELSEYCDSLVEIAVDNRHDNAVLALKKIVGKLGNYTAVYKLLYPESVLEDIKKIIADTYGPL